MQSGIFQTNQTSNLYIPQPDSDDSMETLLHNLKYELRVLARQPAVSLTVIAVRAVAIAGNMRSE